MFARRCENENPHTGHVYAQHWIKTDLPYLPAHVAVDLPEEWDSAYLCKGIDPFQPDSETSAALEAYAAHTWNGITRLCACGEFFEASTVGHVIHKQHRMMATLSAARKESDYPWAVENRVVKGPVLALFRDREDAERFAEDSMDLRLVNRGQTCKGCGAELLVDVTKVNDMSVFCPNENCTEFAKSFWIEKRAP